MTELPNDAGAIHQQEATSTLDNFRTILAMHPLSTNFPRHLTDVVDRYLWLLASSDDDFVAVINMDTLRTTDQSLRFGYLAALLVAKLCAPFAALSTASAQGEALNITCYCPNLRLARLLLRHTYLLLVDTLRTLDEVALITAFNRNESIIVTESASGDRRQLLVLPARPENLLGSGGRAARNMTIVFGVDYINFQTTLNIFAPAFQEISRERNFLAISESGHNVANLLRAQNLAVGVAEFTCHPPPPVRTVVEAASSSSELLWVADIAQGLEDMSIDSSDDEEISES
jgi:hypothetical protein